MARTRTQDTIDAPPRYDAYFGIVVICTIGLLTALIFLYMDFSSFNPAPKALNKTQAGGGLAPAGNPPAPPQPAPGAEKGEQKK